MITAIILQTLIGVILGLLLAAFIWVYNSK